MPSSESEDFESADEGHSVSDKKERKKRLSSSNYSDNALETVQEPKNIPEVVSDTKKPSNVVSRYILKSQLSK